MNSMKDRLILALDVKDLGEAKALLNSLPHIKHIKIGHRLFAQGGFDFLSYLKDKGHEIFLDLKLHDIPNTVAEAVEYYSSSGIWALTVHTSGGEKMLKAAMQSLKVLQNTQKTLILGVTVLTSFDSNTWVDVHPCCDMEDALYARALAAQRAQISGLVCSPKDLHIIKQAAPDLLTVVPGIRMECDARGDQARADTPHAAIASGASYIVVGRPILQAEDPHLAVDRIVADMSLHSVTGKFLLSHGIQG